MGANQMIYTQVLTTWVRIIILCALIKSLSSILDVDDLSPAVRFAMDPL